MIKIFMLPAAMCLSFSTLALANETPQWPINDPDSVAVFNKLTVIPYQEIFHEGGTGYLDGVKPSDFPEGLAAFAFVDNWRRSAISVRYIFEKNHSNPFPCHNVKEDTVYASTLFQRFSADNSIWTLGDHYGPRILVKSTLPLGKGENLVDYVENEHKSWGYKGEECTPEQKEMEQFSANTLVEWLRTGSVPYYEIPYNDKIEPQCPVECGTLRLAPKETESHMLNWKETADIWNIFLAKIKG